MLELIFKDLKFYKNSVQLVLLFIAFLPFIVFFDKNHGYLALHLGSVVILSKIIGKSCYFEERDNVRNFLKSLPVSLKIIVASKYIETLVLIVISYGVIFAETYVLLLLKLPYYNIFELNKVLVIFSSLLICSAVYLSLYFSGRYSIAQQVMMIFFGVGFFIVKHADLNIINIYTALFVTFVSLLMFNMSYVFSYKLYLIME